MFGNKVIYIRSCLTSPANKGVNITVDGHHIEALDITFHKDGQKQYVMNVHMNNETVVKMGSMLTKASVSLIVDFT